MKNYNIVIISFKFIKTIKINKIKNNIITQQHKNTWVKSPTCIPSNKKKHKVKRKIHNINKSKQ